jgi:hypothetical protein
MTNTITTPASDVAADLEQDLLDAPGGAAFGINARGGSLDIRSNYGRLGRRSEPALADPTASGANDDGTTGTDRSFSFDVSNNSLLASVDDEGTVFRLAISSGLVPVYETGLPGVFVDKDLDYVEGRYGIRVETATGERPSVRAADLLDNLIPRSRSTIGAVDLTTVTFAPSGDQSVAPRSVITLTRIVNRGGADETVTATLLASTSSSRGEVRPTVVPGEGFSAGESSATFVLAAGESTIVSAIIGFDRADAHESRSPVSAVRALAETLAVLRSRYGRLSIPADPYFASLFERQGELARQVVLLDADGEHAGSFWGSDANDRADVWMLDLYYSMLPMAQLDPPLCRATIDFFVKYGLPPAAWGNYAALDEGHPLPGIEPVSHSVGNATAAIALAGAYLSATDDVESLTGDPEFMGYATSIIQLLLDSREEGEALFPSVFISDGPSRGDFHTGSNIKAWYAITTMARILGTLPGEAERAAAWSVEADRVRDAIYDLCQGDAAFGPEFFEGVYRDGGHVAGHDGEESDLTLAAFYGFADIDEERVVNHALSAFSTDNPYFVPATGGVSWWDFQWHGPTFPAFVHALSGAAEEEQLLGALEGIRQRTDLDGSVWWWPHLHTETERDNVLRGPGKCGWAAGVYLAKFVHDILGLRPDATQNTLTFAPFLPWDSFEWMDARLGAVAFDAAHSKNDGSVSAFVRNRTESDLVVKFELLLPEGMSVSTSVLDGREARETVRMSTRFGRVAVRAEAIVKPGESTELTLELQPFSARHEQVTGS